MSTGTAPTRPVLRYYGGKFRIAEWVISHFPPHRVYVEPFGGAASVLLQKNAALVEVYNDLDSHVVSLFRILRDPARAEELRWLMELTPFSREEHARSFEQSSDPLEEARRFLVRSFQSLGNKDRCKTNGWRTRTAKSLWSPCVALKGWLRRETTARAQSNSPRLEILWLNPVAARTLHHEHPTLALTESEVAA